jgi:hypothetical protein
MSKSHNGGCAVKTKAILMMCVVSWVAAIGAQASTIQPPLVIESTDRGVITIQDTEDAGTLTISQNDQIVMAELQFEDALPVGLEIEVWPVLEGEVPAWDLVGPEFPFDRNLWITDERTGNVVRFDVTQIARAWQDQSLPNLGFVFRTVSDADEEGQQTELMALDGATEFSLVYHLLQVRPLKDSGDPHTGKAPRTERQSGNETE